MPRPRKLQHPVLGELTWEEQDILYAGRAKLGAAEVRVEVLVDPEAWEGKDLTEAFLVDQAAQSVDAVRARWNEIQTEVEDFLVEAYDDEWRGDRPELSGPELMRHLAIDAIAIYHDGTSDLGFRDDAIDEEGLFSGHFVAVNLEPDGEIADIVLAG